MYLQYSIFNLFRLITNALFLLRDLIVDHCDIPENTIGRFFQFLTLVEEIKQYRVSESSG